MRALVTGAEGFVGKYLIQHLIESGDDVCASVVKAGITSLPCHTEVVDVSNQESCRRVLVDLKPEVIYHLAGVSFVPEAEDNFLKALTVNVLGTSNIFRTVYLLDFPCKIVLVSSAEVYGKVKSSDLPIKESTPIAPANNYSLSKAMSELVAQRYGGGGKLSHVVMRPFNHIGAGQDLRFVTTSFARQLALIARGESPPVIKVGNLDAKRDFSDVRDIVCAYRLAAQKGSGIYNLGSGRAISIRSILDLLIVISGQKVDIQTDPSRMRAAEVPEVYCSYEKASSELGWQPKVELRESLEAIYKYCYDLV
jgi:GDP-4-dehydro-6-deoxy-D-mannose reductase